MRHVSFEEKEERRLKRKTGGELNLTLMFYEYDPRSCNGECNLGVSC